MKKITCVQFKSSTFYNEFKKTAKRGGMSVRQLLEKGMILAMECEKKKLNKIAYEKFDPDTKCYKPINKEEADENS